MKDSKTSATKGGICSVRTFCKPCNRILKRFLWVSIILEGLNVFYFPFRVIFPTRTGRLPLRGVPDGLGQVRREVLSFM
jgi:hypothetical protein